MIKEFDYIKIDDSNKNNYIDIIAKQNWSAAKYLAKALVNQKMFDDYFKEGNVYIMEYNKDFVGFATLSIKDCINDNSLFPWIGFLFINEKYRHHRYSQIFMEYLEQIAFKKYPYVYICTNHKGLYEKYGYTYLFDRLDLWNEKNMVYIKYKN